MKFKEGDKAYLPVYITLLASSEETHPYEVTTKNGFAFMVDEDELIPDFDLDEFIKEKGLYIQNDLSNGDIDVRQDNGELIAYWSFYESDFRGRAVVAKDIDTQILALWMLKRYIEDECAS